MLTGGEVRVETPNPLVHAALMTEGVSLTSAALPALYVLQQALGGTSFVQNGSNSSSKILKAASAVTGQPFTVSAVSFSPLGMLAERAICVEFEMSVSISLSLLVRLSPSVMNL